jgi:hypothetical protein
MIVLGLLLVLLAVGATAVALTAPTATPQVVNMTAVGVTVRASPLAMFLAGAVSVLLLGLGLALISQGTRRKARARKTLRRLRKDQAATPEVSADERENSSRRDGLRDGNGTDTTKNGSNDHSAKLPPEPHSDSDSSGPLRPD